MAKKNPILDAFEKKKEQEFAFRRRANEEISIIAMIIAADDSLEPEDPQMIGLMLDDYFSTKEILARDMLEDIKSDREMVYTRCDLARRLKQTLGRDLWVKYRERFPLLREYWECDGMDEDCPRRKQ